MFLWTIEVSLTLWQVPRPVRSRVCYILAKLYNIKLSCIYW